MSCQSHYSRFYHPHNSGWGVQIIKIFIMQFSQILCYLVLLRPKYSPQHPISNTLSLRFSPTLIDQVSHPYKTVYDSLSYNLKKLNPVDIH
jgi:hypothetical protein